MITGLVIILFSLVNEVETQDELSNNSAKALGSPIEVRNNHVLSEEISGHNRISSLILKLESQQTNIPSNPLVITTSQPAQQKPRAIDGVFSRLTFNDFQSSVSLNSGSLKSQIALPLGVAWNLELTGYDNNLTAQPNWTVEPSFSLKKFTDWLKEEISNSQLESKHSSSPANGIRVIVPNELKNSMATLNDLDNFSRSEIDQTPQTFLNLGQSVQALSNRQISNKPQFSWDANFNNVSVGLISPLPGFLKDEVEFINNTNFSEILNNNIHQNNPWKGTVSLKYRVAINESMKLELQNDYNINNHSHSTFIRWIEKH